MSTDTPKPTIQKEGPLTSRDVPGREDVQRPQDQPASVDDPGAAASRKSGRGDAGQFEESAKQQGEQSEDALENVRKGYD